MPNQAKSSDKSNVNKKLFNADAMMKLEKLENIEMIRSR